MGSFLDFVIPGGALGNTAAAFMAREMGLPLRRLICGVTLGRKCGGSMENEQGIEWKREYLQVLMSSYKDCYVTIANSLIRYNQHTTTTMTKNEESRVISLKPLR